MSLYADYVRERTGKSVMENEHGFIVYSFSKEYCYIEDVFVAKSHRKLRTAFDFADEIVIEAKAKGCTKLLGSVCPSAEGSTASLKFLLAYDFKLLSSIENLIYFTKDI